VSHPVTQHPQIVALTPLEPWTMDNGLGFEQAGHMPHTWAESPQAGQSTPELLCTEDGGRCLWRHLGITGG
jgi:hypothetical protein